MPIDILGTFRRFARDESGLITVEFVIGIPLLFWAWMMTFVFSDAYRARSLDVKASYTIADTLSRESQAIDAAYMTSLFNLQGVMTGTGATDHRLRVSLIQRQSGQTTPTLKWSRVQGGGSELTQATLAPLLPRVPNMMTGETLILVETWQDYRPDFSVGLPQVTFQSFVVMRPRFVAQLCWTTTTPPTTASITC